MVVTKTFTALVKSDPQKPVERMSVTITKGDPQHPDSAAWEAAKVYFAQLGKIVSGPNMK